MSGKGTAPDVLERRRAEPGEEPLASEEPAEPGKRTARAKATLWWLRGKDVSRPGVVDAPSELGQVVPL